MHSRSIRKVQDARAKLAQKFAQVEATNRYHSAGNALLCPVHQPLEARVTPERGKVGVNSKPTR
jgi:hypothetical protein